MALPLAAVGLGTARDICPERPRRSCHLARWRPLIAHWLMQDAPQNIAEGRRRDGITASVVRMLGGSWKEDRYQPTTCSSGSTSGSPEREEAHRPPRLPERVGDPGGPGGGFRIWQGPRHRRPVRGLRQAHRRGGPGHGARPRPHPAAQVQAGGRDLRRGQVGREGRLHHRRHVAQPAAVRGAGRAQVGSGFRDQGDHLMPGRRGPREDALLQPPARPDPPGLPTAREALLQGEAAHRPGRPPVRALRRAASSARGRRGRRSGPAASSTTAPTGRRGSARSSRRWPRRRSSSPALRSWRSRSRRRPRA